MQNNFSNNFQGQLPLSNNFHSQSPLSHNFQGQPPPFPPFQLPPIARPEPLTVPDFPPPFYSNQQQPPLPPPPVQDNSVNVLQLIRSIESQQQLELEELQGILQILKNNQLQATVKIHKHVEQTKIDLVETLILLCSTKLQSIRLALNLNNTIEFYRL